MALIRKAVVKDLPRISELYEELTEEKNFASAATLERVFKEIEAMPGHELLVAEEAGAVVGSLLVQVVPNLSHQAKPWAIVENMIVDSRFRNKGIGWDLMQAVIERARQAGCYKVQLMSNKKRLPAHEFYRTLGFEDSALGFRLYL